MKEVSSSATSARLLDTIPWLVAVFSGETSVRAIAVPPWVDRALIAPGYLKHLEACSRQSMRAGSSISIHVMPAI